MKHTVREVSLTNGSKGLLINVPDAKVMVFDFNFRAGEYLVDPNKWETAHLLEHVLLGANEKYPNAIDFHAELEKNGAYWNASTSFTDIDYEAECADFEWERILDLILLSISKPLFIEKDFRSELGNVKEELRSRSNNNYRRLGMRMTIEAGLTAKTDEERIKIIKNIKLEDLKEHYLKTHFTKNLRFIVVGNINNYRRKEIITKIESISLPKGKNRFELPKEIPKKVSKPVLVYSSDVSNIYFDLNIYLNRYINNSEQNAFHILNIYLTETLYSKIFGKAREMGIIYGMSSGLNLEKLYSSWWFSAQVSEENILALLDIIERELLNVYSKKILIKDLESTKRYIIGRFQRSAQTAFGILREYADRYFFDEYIIDFLNYPENIKKVKSEDIVLLVRNFINESLWEVGLLGKFVRNNKKVDEIYQKISNIWREQV